MVSPILSSSLSLLSIAIGVLAVLTGQYEAIKGDAYRAEPILKVIQLTTLAITTAAFTALLSALYLKFQRIPIGLIFWPFVLMILIVGAAAILYSFRVAF